MSPSKILALITLFVASTFAQTEWKEFTSPEGNFRVVFPETPQQQADTGRNLHQFSATAGAESYGIAYTDYLPDTNWESAVNSERDSILKSLGGSVVDEKRTTVEGYPGKRIRFDGQNTRGELDIYFVGRRLYALHAFAPRGTPRPQKFSEFLNPPYNKVPLGRGEFLPLSLGKR